MSEKKATFMVEIEKVTKNTVRYTERPEEGHPPVVGTIYVQKWFLGSNPPNILKVTIEE